jgi:O-antigen ligase/tetratricopeptide (TPR) repeat protein
MKDIEYYLLWFIRVGLGLLLLMPFIVTGSLFFPFITGKNFFFRIVVELLFGVWMALAVIAPQYRPRRSPMLIALCFFVGAITLATIFGADPYQSFWSNLERMEGLITHLHLLALFLVAGHAVRTKAEWAYAVYGIVGVGVIVTGHAILQYFGLMGIVGAYRPYATFGNSIYLAGYLIFSLFLSVLLCLRASRAVRSFMIALILLQGFAFFVAASRGAFIGFVVGVLSMLVVLAITHKKQRWYRIALGAGFGLVALLVVLIVVFSSSVFVQRIELFSRFASISIHDLKSDPRIMVWGMAIDGFLDRPLLGWGPENFLLPFAKFYNPALYGNEPWFDRTHNMFLEWLVAGGVIGFTAYLGDLSMVFWMLRRLVRSNNLTTAEAAVLAGMFLAYTIQNAFVFDNIISYTVVLMMYAFVHAMRVHHGVQERHTRISGKVAVPIIALICSLTVVYIVNIRPLQAARGVNDILIMLSRAESIDAVFAKLDMVAGLDTFATAEARERLADFAIEIAPRFQGKPSPEGKRFMEKAIEVLKQQAARQPLNPKYPLFLGRAQLTQALWTKTSLNDAEQSYAQTIKLAPSYVAAHIALAEHALFSNDLERARDIAKNIFNKAPQSENMFYDTLTMMVATQDVDGALYVIRRHTAANDKDPVANLFQSDRISNIVAQSPRVTDHKKRLVLLEELARWSKPNIDLYFALAQTYADMGNIERSKEYAYKAVEINPELKTQVDAFFKNRGK